MAIQSVDSLIRQGQGDSARRELERMKSVKIPRTQVVEVANLARRAGLSNMALRLLNPIVRSESPIYPEVSAREIAVYGATLVKIGARNEAQELLKSLSPSLVPEVLLYRSYAYFTEWRYGAAVPLLRRFTRLMEADVYQKNLGLLNLAAALVMQRKIDEADEILQNVLSYAKGAGLKLLIGNALELRTQVEIYRGELKAALSLIGQSTSLLRGTDDANLLLAEKWQAVIETAKDPKSLTPLLKVRDKAVQRKNWEVVRDCDFHSARYSHNSQILSHVLFGTPFSAYRRFILKSIDFDYFRPESYLWILNEKKEANTDSESETVPELDLEPSLRRLMKVLSLDFYRPWTFGEIFSELYPGEVFNPVSSPHRVARLVGRLQKELRNQTGMTVHRSEGKISLKSTTRAALQIKFDREILDLQSERMAILRSFWPVRSFTSEDARAALQVEPHRLLQWAVTEKLIRKWGRGRATFYRFAG